MGDLIKLSDVRNSCDLSNKTGEELLKSLIICAKDSDKTPEYEVFMSAIKALHDSNEAAVESSLRMQVRYDREKQTVDFNFKFEKV